mgnify:CR=1 FL=1
MKVISSMGGMGISGDSIRWVKDMSAYSFSRNAILVDIFHLFGYGDKFTVRIVVHVFCQVDEAFHGYFGFVGVHDEQAVECVERVEQEVWIDLSLVESQFRFVAFVFYFFAFLPLPVDFGKHSYGKTERGNHDVE